MASFADPAWQREASRRSLELRQARAAMKFRLKTGQTSFLDACADPSIWGLKLVQVLEFCFANVHAGSGKRPMSKATSRAARFGGEHQLPLNTYIEQLKLPTLKRIQELLDEHPNCAFTRRHRAYRLREAA